MNEPSPKPPELKRRLATFYLFAYSATGALFPIYPLILSERGFSPSQISWVVVVNSVFGVLVPPLWGYLADRFRVREKMLRFVLLGSMVTVNLLIFPVTVAGGMAAMAAFCFFRAAIASLADATAYASLTERSQFGNVRAFGSLGFAICATLAGVFSASKHGTLLVLSCSVLFAAAAYFSPVVPQQPHTSSRMDIRRTLREVFRSGLGTVLLANVLYYGAHTVFDLYFALSVRMLGHDELFGSIGWAIAVLAEVLVMLRASTLIARADNSRILVLCAGIAAFRWFMLAMFTHPAVLLAVQVLHGFTFGLWYLALTAHMQKKVSEDVRTSVQAVLLGSLATGSVIGSLTFGEIVERHGSSTAYAVACGVSLCALALYAASRSKSV
jgi:PPP family 3-phenylpropionic acid transporter